MRHCRITILTTLALISIQGLAAGELSNPSIERCSNSARTTYTPVFSSETNLPPRTVDCVPEPMQPDAYDQGYHYSRGNPSSGLKANLARFHSWTGL